MWDHIIKRCKEICIVNALAEPGAAEGGDQKCKAFGLAREEHKRGTQEEPRALNDDPPSGEEPCGPVGRDASGERTHQAGERPVGRRHGGIGEAELESLEDVGPL